MTDVSTNTPPTEAAADASMGRLSVPARSAFIYLLARGYVMIRTKPEFYASLLANDKAVLSVLIDLNLTMQVDHAAGLVALRSLAGTAEEEGEGEDDEDKTVLIRRQRLSQFQSIIVLILRRHHRDRSLAGDSVITMEIEQIEQALVPFMHLTQSQTREDKRLNGALALCKKHGLILNVRGDESRIEISPLIRLVVDLNWLDTLLTKFKEMAERSKGAAADA